MQRLIVGSCATALSLPMTRNGPGRKERETIMTQPNNRQPTHRLYIVKGEGENARWTDIGAAWTNIDGKGFSISLDAIPLGGRIVMREITGKEGQS